MENITTEIYKGTTYWHVVIKKNNEYITTCSFKTKGSAVRFSQDSEFLEQRIELEKIFTGVK